MLHDIFTRLFAHFAPQRWWPGETPFEVMVGAILTQNTNWQNVERAIAQLKSTVAFTPHAIFALPPAMLAAAIRPAGYFNIKTGRLRNFLTYFVERYNGNVETMRQQPIAQLRTELLGVRGIGPETADSILLYALDKPVFVVDTYTQRVLSRHYLVPEETTYDDVQSIFMDSLAHDVRHFNEYHALLVAVGKTFCRRTNPQCEQCPLKGVNW
ncbi:MAG: endonuclease III domain-containing protein [Deltaproteobacteria bacterium]|nr:endonuclease III domain-containing protein [Deltaproteobacteria bacterium]